MAVNATFGTIEYREGGVIAVPVSFAEGVIVSSKTVFSVVRVSGDALMGIEYYLLGENTAFELIFEIPPDRSGSFRISAGGNVLKATGAWDTVTATAKDVAYSTVEPELIDRRVVRVRAADRVFPDDQMNTPSGDRLDCILQFNTRCTLNDPVTEFGSDDATFADFLDYAGSNLDPPNFYRKTDNDFPMEADLPLDEVLVAADWTQEGLTLDANEATIYLLRWTDIAPSVDFEVTIKSGFVRGPVR